MKDVKYFVNIKLDENRCQNTAWFIFYTETIEVVNAICMKAVRKTCRLNRLFVLIMMGLIAKAEKG